MTLNEKKDPMAQPALLSLVCFNDLRSPLQRPAQYVKVGLPRKDIEIAWLDYRLPCDYGTFLISLE